LLLGLYFYTEIDANYNEEERQAIA